MTYMWRQHVEGHSILGAHMSDLWLRILTGVDRGLLEEGGGGILASVFSIIM